MIPRSSEDQEYLIKLASLVSKNIPEPIILEKCKEFFSNSGYDSYFSSNEGDKLNILCYCHNCESKFPLRNIKWIDFSEEEEPILHSDQETLEDLHWILTEGGYSQNESVDAAVAQIIKKSVHNKDSDIFYPHGEDYDKYHGLKPMCAKFPICPSPFSYFDLQLKNEQYNLEDHKKGKYDY